MADATTMPVTTIATASAARPSKISGNLLRHPGAVATFGRYGRSGVRSTPVARVRGFGVGAGGGLYPAHSAAARCAAATPRVSSPEASSHNCAGNAAAL
jgi:hypothetical protein